MKHYVIRCERIIKGQKCNEILLHADMKAQAEEGKNSVVLICEKCGGRTTVKL